MYIHHVWVMLIYVYLIHYHFLIIYYICVYVHGNNAKYVNMSLVKNVLFHMHVVSTIQVN